MALVPWRMNRYIPFCSFSSASTAVVASWSESGPAATYAARSFPERPGACPSTGMPSKRASLAITPGSPAIVPGKFMSSPRPITPGSSSKPARSSASSTAPEVSRGVAGTQDGSITKTFSGVPAADSMMYLMPSAPITFAISWQSVTTVVVPRGTTVRANSGTVNIVLSRWMCASIRPGVLSPEIDRLGRRVPGVEADYHPFRDRHRRRVHPARQDVHQQAVRQHQVNRGIAPGELDHAVAFHMYLRVIFFLGQGSLARGRSRPHTRRAEVK
jgi:hypothetical protein